MNSALRVLLVTNLLSASLVVNSQAQSNSHKVKVDGKAKDTPIEILQKADILYDSAVGYAGERTPTYSAFSQLYNAGKTSRGLAKHLIADATPAGKIYGYLILRHLVPYEAEAATRQLLKDQGKLTIMNGCVMSSSSVNELVTRIQKGELVIQLPAQMH